MTINKEFIEQFVNVTQKAALSSYYFIGKKNFQNYGKFIMCDTKKNNLEFFV